MGAGDRRMTSYQRSYAIAHALAFGGIPASLDRIGLVALHASLCRSSADPASRAINLARAARVRRRLSNQRKMP